MLSVFEAIPVRAYALGVAAVMVMVAIPSVFGMQLGKGEGPKVVSASSSGAPLVPVIYRRAAR